MERGVDCLGRRKTESSIKRCASSRRNSSSGQRNVPVRNWCPASGALFWDGQFAEMIAFSADMFAQDNLMGFDDVNKYLANVYGLLA
jgi:hypothetical protein